MSDNDGIIVIDTPAGIEHFRFASMIASLKIEISTGMRHSRGSVMNAAKAQFGIQKQTKKGVLAELLTIYKDTYGWEYGSRR